jgi:hypothetical protein
MQHGEQFHNIKNNIRNIKIYFATLQHRDLLLQYRHETLAKFPRNVWNTQNKPLQLTLKPVAAPVRALTPRLWLRTRPCQGGFGSLQIFSIGRMPGNHTLHSLDASHAIPMRVLRFKVSGLRRRTPVRPVPTGQTHQ